MHDLEVEGHLNSSHSKIFAPSKVAKIIKNYISTSKDFRDRDDFLREGKNSPPYAINVVKIGYTL